MPQKIVGAIWKFGCIFLASCENISKTFYFIFLDMGEVTLHLTVSTESEQTKEKIRQAIDEVITQKTSIWKRLKRELNLDELDVSFSSSDHDFLELKLKPSSNRVAIDKQILAFKLETLIANKATEGVAYTIQLENASSEGQSKQQHAIMSQHGNSNPKSKIKDRNATPYESENAASERQSRPQAEVMSQYGSSNRNIVISGLITSKIKDKTATPYDFYVLMFITLKKDFSPKQIKDNDGLNMLHQCALHQRLVFLEVLLVLGFWQDLIDTKVPRDSNSEYANCDPRTMAVKSRQWKLAREIDRLSEVEHTMAENSSLFKAIREKDADQVRGILDKNNNLSQVLASADYIGSTCIHWACRVGSFPLLKYFRDNGANVHAKDKQDNTALHCAATWGHHNLVNYLVKICKIDASLRNQPGRTALELTALNGDVKSLEFFAKCGVPIEPITLILSSYAGRLPYLQQCLNVHKLDTSVKDKNGKTCLMVAAEQGYPEIVKYLLQKFTFKLDEVDNRKRTIFHLLSAKNMEATPQCAKLILDEASKLGKLPAVLNLKDCYHLQYDCYTIRGLDNGRPAWHHIHLKRQMQPYFEKASKGGTIDAGIIGQPITSGWDEQPTPEFLRSCVEQHKNDRVTKDGHNDITALSYALLKDKREIAKQYIEAGAAIDVMDCYGLYPIHFSVMCADKELTQMLLAKGASLAVRDENGKTPIELAKDNNQFEMVNYLEGDSLISKGIVSIFLEHFKKYKFCDKIILHFNTPPN